MNGDRLTLRPEATAGIVRAMIEHNALYNGPLRLWSQVADVPPRAAAEGPLPPVPPDRRRGARLRRPRRRRRADPDVPRAAARPRPRRGRDVRLELNSLGQPDERLRAPRRADRALRAARRRCSTTTRGAACTANPLRILDSKNPAMQAIDRGGAAADRFPRRRVARALRRRARRARRRRARLPRQPAPGARPRLLQPHRVRVGHRPARRAGHGLRRRPLRRPVRAARRQADAGGRLGHGRRAHAAAARGRRRADATPARSTPTRSCPSRRAAVALDRLRGAARRRRLGADARRRQRRLRQHEVAVQDAPMPAARATR